ncbi:Rrn6 domain containing protein [Pyrenophora tritici-repentis]|nr:Rrn6 domain containing protein [Pyrenophora tritici-repentis]KAI0587299.1 Rrn6 domain-containing protein [Pyrenophora tritici-repentis]KAI0590437.1 Rrn6 domain-containing protein [Pyrenophora tritici-repentis]KAI1576270.1 Rrn6 domain containing protein [Pyrenophora tritici-repentis]KAI1600343.1 Rrn6 domain containing protein [Pyrenophora tritici-repentis]
MADKPLEDGNSGRPGIASYDVDNREWVFPRYFAALQLKQIRPVTDKHTATSLATTPARFPLPTTHAKRSKTKQRTGVRKRIKGLVKTDPVLCASLGLLPDLDLSSAAVSSARDPLVGNLLSFGSITLGNRYETPRRVAALATGEAGNILQLAIVNKEIYDWGQAKKTWVDGPTLKEAPLGYWNEDAAPIQQICFAQSEDRSCLLAVRLPTRTVLLRPLYHRQVRTTPSSSFYDLPKSVIEPHPVLTIHHKETGGSPHVDFAFNPDNQLQFALAHQDHTWSVWNMHHPRKGDKYSPSRLARGRINKLKDNDVARQDEWARILWVANPHTLLVCNRRHLGIISIKTRPHFYRPYSGIFSEKQSEDWILDVKRHPKDTCQFFVLTSSLLILMAVTTSSGADTGADEAVVTTLQSWKHCRDAKDFTLQIQVQLVSDTESFVIVYSTLNTRIQVYSYSKSSSSSPALVACSDPSLLSLGLDESIRINTIHTETMQQEGVQNDVNFFRLFVTLSDGDMQELVVCSSSLEATGSYQVIMDFKKSTIKHPRAGNSKKDIVHVEDDFIVPNRLAFAGAPRAKITSQLPRLLPPLEIVVRRHFRRHETRRRIGRSLVMAHRVFDGVDVVETASEVRQMLTHGLDVISTPFRTLMEHANMKVIFFDFGEASSGIEELFSLQNRHATAEIRHIASGSRLELSKQGNTTPSDVYDDIVEKWVTPLSPKIAVRVRLANERLAQQIAMELVLSSTRVREHGVDDQIIGPQSQDSVFHSSSQFFSSQPLPTPPLSSFSGSSPPMPPSTTSNLSGTLTRLGMHLSLRESSQTLASIASSNPRVLARWQPGNDVRTFIWAESDVQLEAIQKQRKKIERREKRQQRKTERMRLKDMSQFVSFPQSSPGPMLGNMAKMTAS